VERISDVTSASEEPAETITEGHQRRAQPKTFEKDWSKHPLNLRVTLSLPFGRWYVTLVAGNEKRSKERLVEERKKHPLETIPNLLFLLSVGVFMTSLMLIATALVLIHAFDWSIQLHIPA